MPRFWRTWLNTWCAVVCLFGVVLAGAAFEATDSATRTMFSVLNDTIETEFNAPLRFSVALLGAITIGWSITLYAAIRAAHRLGRDGTAVWRLITVGIAVWYVVDGSLSVATGFGPNAISNTLLLAGYLIPVLRTGVMRG